MVHDRDDLPTALTAITVQDTVGVRSIHPVSAELLEQQARTVLEDMPVVAFKIGVQLAIPFLVVGLLVQIGLGMLGRLMPQLQVFFLAVPASILGGMLVLLAVVGVMMGVFLEDLGNFLRQFTGN